jgi:hypothetical protein
MMPAEGIYITSINPPAQGWPVLAHCPKCKKTEIVVDAWARKPEDGDYWLIKDCCLSEDRGMAILHTFSTQRRFAFPLTDG